MQTETSRTRIRRIRTRWASVILSLSIVAVLTSPMVSVSAQTTDSTVTPDLIGIVPDTVLIYAEANLDGESDQMVLLMELLQRAGVDDALDENDMSNDGEIPPGAHIGLAVTSIPETGDADVAGLVDDPLGATDTLEDGGFAAIIATDDSEGFFQTTLDDIEQSGDDVVESEYGGVMITSAVPASDDEFSDPQAVAMVNDLVVIGVFPEDIHPLIDTANGDVPGLAEDQVHQELMGLLPEARVASGFINGPALLAGIEATSPEALLSIDDQTLRALDAWTVFSFSAEQQGFLLETRSMANATPFAETPPLDTTFIDSVPSDALLVLNGVNIDSSGALSSIAMFFVQALMGEDIFATPVDGLTATPDPAELFAQSEALLGFNLQTDFIDNLVGQFGIFVSVGDLANLEDGPEIDALVMSEVEDTVAVEDVLAKLSFIVGAGLGDQQSVETRNVNGSTVYSIDISDTDVAQSLEYGVVDGELVISIGSGLDDYLLGPGSPLSADPNFSAVMAQLPSDYTSLTYVNIPAATALVLDATSSMGSTIEDADESCADYATQQEAQDAYDADQFANFSLDMDFDGEACEDFFAPDVATPADDVENPFSAILGLGTASTQEDGINGTTTFLLIGGE